MLFSVVSAQEGKPLYSSCTFTFKIKQTAATSAGIFDTEGRLLKTLWSGVTYATGTHKATWDGTDDEGRPMPAGNYQVKVLSNNVKYTWEGVIGNTSASFTGPTVHHAHERILGVAIVGNKAYYTTGFNEQGESNFKFYTDKPQSREVISQKGISTRLLATDGVRVYWAGEDSFNNRRWMVYATNVVDDKETLFDHGTIMITKHGNKFNSSLDTVHTKISGLAVQKRGNFLFIAHQDINEVHILNKSTGSFIKNVFVSSPKAMCVDQQDNLWLIYNKEGKDVAEKFSIKPDGSLSLLHVIINNLIQPLAIAVAPDNKTLLVADAGISQQIKAYNNLSGAVKWIMGEEGGYAQSPDVTNSKFYFSDMRGVLGTTIAFEPDGSFWIEDPGNSRLQHYSATRQYINRIMYLGTSYSCSVGLNNPTRLFSDYLEFKIDYLKHLKPDNGSWTLVKNWGYVVPANLNDHNRRLIPVVTLRNHRTYGLLYNSSKHNSQVVELPVQGNMRITDVALPSGICQLNADGSITQVGVTKPGQPLNWYKYLLEGFDNVGNPIWSKSQLLASVAIRTTLDPIYQPSPINLHVAEITSSGIILAFNAARSKNGNDGWHLGGVKAGNNQWLWRTALSTSENYSGNFPTDGKFDSGNKVRYAGSTSLAIGRNIFWGYHGEFWKNSQVNKWNHVYDDGLFVGQFGAIGPSPNGPISPYGMAGNAYAASVVKDNVGNLYLYHNDENHHSGVHRWKITNLNTITEQTIPVQLNTTTQNY
ncbi:FlgD immunoglobulin-like domain containing protein [Mucilaginibacter robiniae]|uniref:FlgD immunoglobulin-like domain containing protein n=1 Tax=Mucilaginibacter robiniae TaxID=2728022 RepID=UPI001B7CF396|nr:FlgD immunoglobulin-like domain containing protein [Mucilaginibacter robiniae]